MAVDNSIVHQAGATASFVLSHFFMSGPLRSRLVSASGVQSFLMVYSLTALCTLAWTVVAFDRAVSTTPLWDGTHPILWAISSILTIIAVALILPSFMRNPALPGAKASGLGTVIPSGVFTITRHPMMWGFSLWALAHILVAPETRIFIFMGSLIVVGLLGSHFQDKRKLAGNNREFEPWQRRTTFWLNISQFGRIGTVWLIAIILWFIATTVHWQVYGIPAGMWAVIG